jgi:uncharacterized repeat protein (TIGR01451 family)
LEARLLPTAYVVTSIADSGPGSLRQAILDSNAISGTTNSVSFQMTGTGVQTIELLSPLNITAPVVLDATTQPGFAGSPVIALDGANETTAGSAIIISAGDSTVSGLSINGFSGYGLEIQNKGGDTIANCVVGTGSPAAVNGFNSSGGILINGVGGNSVVSNLISGNKGYGITLQGSGAINNQVRANFIGTNQSGTVAAANSGGGVQISQGASSNTIGGNGAGVANVISGNATNILVTGPGTSNNLIAANLVGTDKSGGSAILGSFEGVVISGGASNNTVGGTDASYRNVIARNDYDGVLITDVGTNSNVIEGNYIGTDVAGLAALGNGTGVTVQAGASGTTIGGDSSGAGNLISGNPQAIELLGTGNVAQPSSHSVVRGNLIGTDKTGSKVIPQSSVGIRIFGSPDNTIGGADSGQGNLISTGSNQEVSIGYQGANDNLVEGNLIGTDITGTISLGDDTGVEIFGSAMKNTIGGAAPGAGNVIAGSTGDGILIEGVGTSQNIVLGNFVGTDRTGKIGMANHDSGIRIQFSATDNLIGGGTPGAGNIIAANNGVGVVISGSGTSGNSVEGNLIGTDSTGMVSLPNSRGVDLFGGASGNTIGGLDPDARNVISGNTGDGLEISDTGSSNNVVLGNLIGCDINGETAVPNGNFGISVYNGATSNTIGGTDARAGNVISGNAHAGVALNVAGTSGNVVVGNLIGVNREGATALPNEYGLDIYDGASGNIIGGAAAGSGNVIAGNHIDGIRLSNVGTSANLVQGNAIGTNSARTGAVPNAVYGVEIDDAASGNTVGGTSQGTGNLISGNAEDGVRIWGAGTSGNQLQGNLVGTNSTGTAALGNNRGVEITLGATGNTVGGTVPGARNLISGNSTDGVALSGAGTEFNVVEGNVIGVSKFLDGALPNGTFGVSISLGATNNTIGGIAPNSGNVIANNPSAGVFLTNVGTAGNLVARNTISTKPFSQSYGVEIAGGAGANTIGAASGGNEITAFDNATGIAVTDLGTNGNLLLGNSIHGTGNSRLPAMGISISTANYTVIAGNQIAFADSDGIDLVSATGTKILGNTISRSGLAGIEIDGASAGNIIGGELGSGASNIIESNGGAGILLNGANVGFTTIQGNYIGIDPAHYLAPPYGPTNTGNAGDGIVVGGHNDNLGGLVTEGNVISENAGAGINIVGQGVGNSLFSNRVFGNHGAAQIIRQTPLAVLAPKLTLAHTTLSGTVVQGFVQPLTGVFGTYRVEVFATDPTTGFSSSVGGQAVSVNSNAPAPFELSTAPTSAGETLLAMVTDPQGNTSTFSPSFTVQAGASDVSVTAVGVPTSIVVGQTITYTLVITNHGPTLATDVGFFDTLPTGVTLVSATVTPPPGPGHLNSSDQFVQATIGDLTPSASATISITVVPKGVGPTTNKINVALAENNPNVSNNALTTNVNVLPTPITATSFSLATPTIKRHKQSVIEIGFGGAIDPGTAMNPAFYSVVTAGRNGQFGTKGSVVVTIASVQMAPSQTAVFLIPKTALPKNKSLQVSVSAAGVHDSFGRPLVGANATGQIVGTITGSVTKAQVRVGKFKV